MNSIEPNSAHLLWRDLSRFPQSKGAWEARDDRSLVAKGEASVRNAAKKWFPLSRTLYSTPTAAQYLPAVCQTELREQIHQQFKSKYLKLSYLCVAYLFIVFVLMLLSSNADAYLNAAIFLAVCLAYLAADYWTMARRAELLQERALFFHWVITSERKLLWSLVSFLVFIGLTQAAYQTFVGPLDTLVEKYGAYYSEINSGELWRYLTGPLIHRDWVHWLVNTSMLVLALGLAERFAMTTVIVVFVVTMVLSVVAAQYLSIGLPIDGFVGISGGVFGILGWCLGTSLRNKNQFPQYFWINLSLFIGVNLLIAGVFNANTSNTAHIIGTAAGCGFGALNFGYKK
jgi:membrane associated rhomboid family serine protease